MKVVRGQRSGLLLPKIEIPDGLKDALKQVIDEIRFPPTFSCKNAILMCQHQHYNNGGSIERGFYCSTGSEEDKKLCFREDKECKHYRKR